MEGARAGCSLRGLALLPAWPHQLKSTASLNIIITWASSLPHKRWRRKPQPCMGWLSFSVPTLPQTLEIYCWSPWIFLFWTFLRNVLQQHMSLLSDFFSIMFLKGVHPVVWHCFCGLRALQRMYGYVSSWFCSCIHHLVSIWDSFHLEVYMNKCCHRS